MEAQEKLQEFKEALPNVDWETRMSNSNKKSSLRRTVDDGYVYPKNATEEEKAAIDAQEYQRWVEAGRPPSKLKSQQQNNSST